MTFNWKPKIVEFADGTFGVQLRSFFVARFADAISYDCWGAWSGALFVHKHCRHFKREQAERTLAMVTCSWKDV